MAKYEQWLTDEGLTMIEGWARSGLNNEQIAVNMGITRETLRVWCKTYSGISAALKKGKEVVDYQVESSLLKRALGYDYQEERMGRDGVKITCRKHIPPDITAQIFWLKNRMPDKWRDRPENHLEEVPESGVVMMPEVKEKAE